MMLCDTNILIEFYKANPAVIQTLQHIGLENIAVSVITQDIKEVAPARATTQKTSNVSRPKTHAVALDSGDWEEF